jgi:RND family efflux transporter MFP subunit
MIGRHPLLWSSGGLIVLAGVLTGCNPNPPVAETLPPPVTVSQPEAREIIDYDDYEGRIAPVETVEVRSRVRGHIQKIDFEDGQMVKKGDLLFVIDPRPYKAELDQAEAEVKLSEAQVREAEAAYQRERNLAARGASSAADVEKALRSVETAKASVEARKAVVEKKHLDLDYTKIVAEAGGRTSRPQVTVGNLVNSGGGETLLTTIVSVDPMYVYFDVPERNLLRYKKEIRKGRADEKGPEPPIKDLKIPVQVGLEGEEGFPHKGFIDFAENQVNPSTGTIQVRGRLDNPDRVLGAGMRARVRIPVSTSHKVLMVTERAVGTDQGLKFLYVVNGENTVERRDVRLGRLAEGLQVIDEGLKPEDRVIVNGIQRVRDGMKVDPKPSPMPGAAAAAEGKSEPTKQGTKG